MFRGLDDDSAGRVEAGPSRPAGDLMELAGLQMPNAHPVVLGQAGEQHGADRDVDAHSQGVGAAHDLQQAGLGQQLDQPPVLGQHPRVVHADSVPHQPRQGAPEPSGEPEVADQVGDRVLLSAGADVQAHQRLGLLDRRRLGEMHDIDGRTMSAQQLFERLVQRRRDVGEVQWHRPVGAGHDRGVAICTSGERVSEPTDVTEGGRHQQELRSGQLDERHLPGPAAVWVGVEVELVHHDQPDVGSRPLAQGEVGQDLSRAADDRRTPVDRRVAGHHADVGRPEGAAQVEELLAHQRLDRRGVEAAPTVGQRGELRARSHE